MGLKTGYRDFYQYLNIINYTNNPIINDIKNHPENWSDYEIGLGNYTRNVTKDNAHDFYNSKDDVDYILLKYLEEQQNNISDNTIKMVTGNFIASLNDFGNVLSPLSRDIYNTRVNAYSGRINYNFVTFNYTNILDRIISCANSEKSFPKHSHLGTVYQDVLNNALHIHGTLSGEMITAVNDISQLKSQDLKNDRDFLNSMIKSRMNERAGNKRIPTAERMINESEMIILFGTSMGLTDLMWWEKIIQWLVENNKHMLYICLFKRDFNEKYKLLLGPFNRITAEAQDKLLSMKENLSNEQREQLRSRINILFNPNIFDFGLVKQK